MANLETVKNAALRMNRKSFSGEVTYEVPSFDEYLSRVQKIRPSKSSVKSQIFYLDWANGLFEIITEAGDQVAVWIKLNDLECGYHTNDIRQWLWEFRCTFSIVDDDQKLFSLSWNEQGQTIATKGGYSKIEIFRGFSVAEYLTAAEAYGKPTTFRIALQYHAGHYEQKTPVYQKKPENLGGNDGNPELLEALHRGAESDFIISCDGHEYPVHRIVLKLASPVLRRMIETPMAEASSNKLVISDVESKVVQLMIDFIYKGRIDVVLDNQVASLLYCAEKYELLALKEYCLQHMKTILSETNVTEFLSCAIKCNAEEAVKELVYWCKIRFWKLLQNDEFRAFAEANLEVFCKEK